MPWWNSKRREQDLERELEADLELEALEQQESGLSTEDARHAALRALGNAALLKEDVREAWGWRFLDRLKQDLSYGLRGMRRKPRIHGHGGALTGPRNRRQHCNLQSDRCRPAPLAAGARSSRAHASGPAEAERRALGQLHVSAGPRAGGSSRNLFGPLWVRRLPFAVRQGDAVEATSGAWVSGGYYATLGLQPVAGRLLTDTDDQPGAAPVAVITDGYWERKFARKPDAIGREIVIEGKPVVVVGVSPAGFTGANVGETADITLPLGILPQIRPDRSYN